MKISKKDWIFIGAVVIILGGMFALTGKEKTKIVPVDDMHRIVYETAFKNQPGPDASMFARAFFKPDKKGAEVFCDPCHKEKGVPYPPEHPAKNRCLFCHKLIKP